jgi:hypothetical protein
VNGNFRNGVHGILEDMTSRKLGLGAAIVLALLALALWAEPDQVEARMNAVRAAPPYSASARARALLASAPAADLHADSLLWGRDLLRRGDRGQIDVPRLAEANVAVQFFGVVTQSPRGQNVWRNDDRMDLITPLAVLNRWPPRTWPNTTERALYQAKRLGGMAERSEGKLVLLRTRGDLKAFLERRSREPGLVGGLLALEGSHALRGDLHRPGPSRTRSRWPATIMLRSVRISTARCGCRST